MKLVAQLGLSDQHDLACDSGPAAAIAPGAPVAFPPFADGRAETDAAAIIAAPLATGAFLARHDRQPRGVTELALLTDGAAGGFEHLEQSFVHGVRLHVVRSPGNELAKILRGGQNVGALPSGHRRRGTEAHYAYVPITDRYRPLDDGT